MTGVSNVTLPAQGTGTTTPVVESSQIASDGVSVRQVVQIGGLGANNAPVAISAGNGTSDTGTLRVTVASDSTGTISATQSGVWTVGISAAQTIAVTNTGTFAVQATLAAGSAVIGHVISDTGSTTAVTQATASNLNATVVGTGTFLVQAAQSSTWTVGLSAAQTLATVTTVGTVTSLSQWAGNAIDTNSGNKSAGTLRTLIATDALAVPLWGHGAAAATVPANATYSGLRAATANPTAVTDGQMVGAMADKVGRQVTVPYAPRDLVATANITITASTAETTLIAAAASESHDILSLNFVNSSATATRVDIRDDTGGTVRAYFYVPAGDMRGQTYTVPFPQTAQNKNWTVTCITSLSSLYVTVQYVKNI